MPDRELLARYYARTPAALAFVLLAFQLYVPWSAKHFLTQDGPSHVYTAVVALDLLTDDDSPYRRAYRFSPQVATNWATTAFAGIVSSVIAAEDLERIIFSFCILAAFGGFTYLQRSLDPQTLPSPILVFLLNTWFLWIGFYNFYLGIALCAWVVGYYIRRPTPKLAAAAALACAFVLLFLTHVLPFCIALLSVFIAALWRDLIMSRRLDPSVSRRAIFRAGAVSLARLVAITLPSTVVLVLFLKSARGTVHWDSSWSAALHDFPMHVFASGRSAIARQAFLTPAILGFAAAGIGCMKKAEWMSAKGALVLCALCSFALYLFAPDRGLEGSLIKMRFAWVAVIFAGVVSCTADRLRRVMPILSLVVGVFVAANLIVARRHNVVRVSRAVEECNEVFSRIASGATFIRVGYRMDKLRARFAFEDLALEPLFHVDAWAAVTTASIDLTDYQPANGVFPVLLNQQLEAFRYALWALERSGDSGTDQLHAVLARLPVAVDYVLVIGDPGQGDKDKLLATLRSEMDFVASDRNNFTVLFRRKRATTVTK